MPSGFWDYIHLGKSNKFDEEKAHDLQKGLFQIATQNCNILVQFNNIHLGFNDLGTEQSAHYGGESSTKNNLFDLEQSVVLLQPKGVKLSPSSTPTKVRFSRLSEYKRRLSVSHNQHNLQKSLVSYIMSRIDGFR